MTYPGATPPDKRDEAYNRACGLLGLDPEKPEEWKL